MKKTILVVFGGNSSEHDISTVSAASVIANLPREKYDVEMLGITKDGQFLRYCGSPELLPEDKWLEGECTPALISTDASRKGLVCFEKGGTRLIKIDAVFPVLHGKNGEDGTMQGLLELAELPFVGCGMTSSAVCMDKIFTNIIAEQNGIPQAAFVALTLHGYRKNGTEALGRAAAVLGFPLFVKPANAGSSIGVTKVHSPEQLKSAVEYAFEFDTRLVLEEGIDAAEVECAVLGNGDFTVSTPGEIVPCNEIYDFEAKYLAGTSELHIPARFSAEKLEEIRATAAKVFEAMGCKGLSRVDFFVRRSDSAVLFNEINTIPGFTSISMYPKLFAHDGIPYSELLDRLIELALGGEGAE